MRAIVKKSTIEGAVKAPPSKSYTHRAIVCGLLSKGITKVSNPLICDDTLATINASRMMGATIHYDKVLQIRGPDELQTPASEIDCHSSGTTLRIFTALASLTNGRCVLTGDASLQARPIGDLLDGLQQLGIDAFSVLGNGKPPLIVQGQSIEGGSVNIRGDVTSQYITGLLFACSRGKGETRIQLTTQLESLPYVEMTLEVMGQFGVQATPSETWSHIDIPGSQEYNCPEYTVEGDYSSAAFLLAAGALSGKVELYGVKKSSMQGDAKVVKLLQLMGASVMVRDHNITINRGATKSIDIDASNTPDLVPVLAVVATQGEGLTTIREAGRLRIKESDRISSVSQELTKMGASVEESQDGLRIRGPSPLQGAVLNPHNDHRIAMAGVIAGLIAEGTTIIENIDCVKKSYPEFIRDMRKLGAQISLEKNDEGGIE